MAQTTSITQEGKMVPDRLSSAQKFWYILINIPFTLLEAIVLMSYANFFFIQMDLGWLYYVGMIIYITIDALNDFYFGRLSDRRKEGSKLGRRTFFLIVIGPIWAIISIVMWIPWSETNILVKFLHFIVSMVAYDTCMTLVTINWLALKSEITDSNQERNRLTYYENAILSVAIVPFVLLISKGFIVGTEFFMNIMMYVVAPLSLIFVISGLKIKERPELYREYSFPSLKEIFKISMRSRSFRVSTFIWCVNLLLGFMGASLLFLQTLILGEELFILLSLIGIITPIIGELIFIKLQKRIDPYKLFMFQLVGSAVILVFNFILLILFDVSEPNEIIIIGLIILQILGTFVGAGFVFYSSLFAASIDESELKTGVRQDGAFNGMLLFFVQVAEGIGPLFATLIYTLSGFMEADRATPGDLASQPQLILDYPGFQEVILGLKIWTFVFTIIVRISMIIVFSRYPLKGKKMMEMKLQLQANRLKQEE